MSIIFTFSFLLNTVSDPDLEEGRNEPQKKKKVEKLHVYLHGDLKINILQFGSIWTTNVY
jgi:hypothetical protein